MDSLRESYDALRMRVLGMRDSATGVWTGKLSSSALGTALAVVALSDGEEPDRRLREAGAAWLVAHANADGGWGDTVASVSNLSTTLIAAAALRVVAGANLETGHSEPRIAHTLRAAEGWIMAHARSLEPASIAQALAAIYGKDRTFAAPIQAFLAICEGGDAAWTRVPPLPFLLSLLPRGVFRFLRLQVVSYALPALIAVGLCRHLCAARACGSWAWGRLFARALLRRLERLQPEHGGFLDAIPLTAFVCLSLRSAGYGGHSVARKGLAFLRAAVRQDGSWAIDSNLRCWVTSLATRAVWADGMGQAEDAERVAAWLLKTQLNVRHPFTGAEPGGWAWTDLPGGVPDADDTAGALIALRRLKDVGVAVATGDAVRKGVRWLLDLQNADGGMPTFCRGWGRLPFDRSCPDISAHALAALAAWGAGSPDVLAQRDAARIRKACVRLLAYLERTQALDGSWVPLWFGHQGVLDGRNPLVGTARVVEALRTTQVTMHKLLDGKLLCIDNLLHKGEKWLVARQRDDGGWGMGDKSTVEETSLAVIALTPGSAAAHRGCAWLAAQGASGLERSAPIGLYFALLWYDEQLYPLIWALEALGRNLKQEKD